MRPRIIAEAAQGYEGKADYCEFYVRAASRAGAEAVKFQIVYADDVAEPGYQYYDWYKKLEMDPAVWQRVKELSRDCGILFFADVSGERAIGLAAQVKPDGIKIHSSNFFDRALLRRAFDTAERVFVSLGGIEEDEIEQLLSDVEAWEARDRLTLLYGFQAEPTPVGKSNLNRLPLLKQRFPGVEIGYMDHAPGESDDKVHLSIMAMVLGADWIEKHITLSRYLEVEDFVSALEPDEFANYVATLDRLASATGRASFTLSDEERAYRDKSVKKLIAADDLGVGHTLTLEDLAFKRTPRIDPFAGFHDPGRVVGRSLGRSLAAGEPVLADDLA
jgi:sialic acid synthase SpsE